MRDILWNVQIGENKGFFITFQHRWVQARTKKVRTYRIEKMSSSSMAKLLNRNAAGCLSTRYDPFLKDPPETQTNEEGSYISHTNREVGKNRMNTYEEWQPRREWVHRESGATSRVDYCIRGDTGWGYGTELCRYGPVSTDKMPVEGNVTEKSHPSPRKQINIGDKRRRSRPTGLRTKIRIVYDN